MMYWINGVAQSQLPVTDRAIHFGDAFFTTARVKWGKIFLLNWHLERMKIAAQRLRFQSFDMDALSLEMLDAASNIADGGIKVLISRGSGSWGYSFKDCGSPVRIMFLFSLPIHYCRWRLEGVRLYKSPVQLGRNPLLAGIKHSNRLEQVLIQAYLKDRNDIDEAIVMDSEGFVVECASANLFWRLGQDVFTPKLNYAGVAGIMRRYVISLLPILGYSLTEITVPPKILETADEVFITNSLLPIASVKKIDDQQYTNSRLCLQLYQLIDKFKF